MRIPGFGRPARRVVVDPATGREFVERDPALGPATTTAPVVDRDTAVRADAVQRERVASDRDARRAYDAGRVDERRTRRGGPGLIGLLVAILAVIGLVFLVLAWRQGSFSGGAAVVDNQLSAVGEQTKAAADKARSDTGQAIENAGDAVKRQGEKIKP